MRGVIGWGTYLPYRRLDCSTIAAVVGEGGGRGHRTVASYDEDTTTMAVEAARRALRCVAPLVPDSLWFASTAPAYSDKTNATAVHAALRLPPTAGAYDFTGAVRSCIGALRAGLGASDGPAMVVASDLRTGLPGSSDESDSGDGAAALVVGSADEATVLAELIGEASVTAEFVDRWRSPGELNSRLWEERFGEQRYTELGDEVWRTALKCANLERNDIGRVVVTGTHTRAVRIVGDRIARETSAPVHDTRSGIGDTGAAQPFIALAAALEHAAVGEIILQVSLSDGADAMVWRVTPALRERTSTLTVSDQVASGGPISYGKYLAWRGWLPVEPPRRPEPMRPSASAAGRNLEWKYGFVGSEREDGSVHLPPSPFDETARPMAEMPGTVVTYTLDRVAYSPSPPIVFAIVDFEGGGRLPVELTDVDPDEVRIGLEVEMTFRRLFTAEGIHNYFWKGRPRRTPA